MADEDHPSIAKAFKFAPVEFSDREEGGEQFAVNLSLYDHTTRVNILDGMAEAIGADDGATLRQKAQLVTMRRRFSAVHNALKVAGR
jgi:hypothetical protein